MPSHSIAEKRVTVRVRGPKGCAHTLDLVLPCCVQALTQTTLFVSPPNSSYGQVRPPSFLLGPPSELSQSRRARLLLMWIERGRLVAGHDVYGDGHHEGPRHGHSVRWEDFAFV